MTSPLPTRLQLRRRKGFDLQSASRATNGLEAVHVGRPSRWGNPFSIAVEGTAEKAVEKFRAWVADDPFGQRLARDAREQLRGKNLACWCSLSSICHASTLLEIANQ